MSPLQSVAYRWAPAVIPLTQTKGRRAGPTLLLRIPADREHRFRPIVSTRSGIVSGDSGIVSTDSGDSEHGFRDREQGFRRS